jgi:hypothetical protein
MDELSQVDAITVGVNGVDVIVQLPDRFTPGEKLPARDLVIQGGGLTATAACVLAAFGWRTGLVTPLSNDAFSTTRGSWALRGDDLLRQPAFSVVAVDTMRRRFSWRIRCRTAGRTAIAQPDGICRLGRGADGSWTGAQPTANS